MKFTSVLSVSFLVLTALSAQAMADDMLTPGPDDNLAFAGDPITPTPRGQRGGRTRRSWRQQRQAAFHFMSRTDVGTYYYTNFRQYFDKFEIYDPASPAGQPFANRFYFTTLMSGVHTSDFRFSSNLIPASAQYLSWIFVHAMTEFRAKGMWAQHTTKPMPEFLEIDQWGFVDATRHWHQFLTRLKNETEASNDLYKDPTHDLDFYNDPDSTQDLARRLDGSLEDFYVIRKKDIRSFLDRVESRRRRLGYGVITLDEYLRDPRLTREEKRAAEALKKEWLKVLSHEQQNPIRELR